MNLDKITKSLKNIAPLSLAEGWDNVGLLIEPSPPHVVNKILLTNDLTEAVMKEGIEQKVGLIVSYHPPIFQSLKRLVWNNPKQRIVTMAMENRVAVYSPHTSCDAVENGVNDWLAKSLGVLKLSHPIKPTDTSEKFAFNVTCEKESFSKSFQRCMSRNFSDSEISERSCTVSCNSGEVPKFMNLISKNCDYMEKLQITRNKAFNKSLNGMGRVCLLNENTTLEELLGSIKYHIGIPHLRVAIGDNKTLKSPLKSVALCAGSGSSILSGMKSDLYLTGEMSHHDVLAATSNGSSVVLCEHSNSERGFLKEFKEQIHQSLNDSSVEILLSQVDKDPLTVL